MSQAAQSVLISLFQLNTPEFTMLLAALPKTFQDGATKLLQNHLKNTGNAAQVTKRVFQTQMLSSGCESLNHHTETLMVYFFVAKLCVTPSGTNGQPSDTPHPPISSQLVQPGYFPHQHLPEHPLTKVTHAHTHGKYI